MVTGAMALFGLMVTSFLTRERSVLAASRHERNLMGERLRANALMQSIAEASGDAIFAKDLHGRYLLCNAEACKVIGKPLEQILGADDRELFEPAAAQRLIEHDAAVLAAGHIQYYEELVHSDGRQWTFLTARGPLRDADGSVIGVFGVSRDITQRKQSEQALHDMSQMARAVGDSVMHHMAVLDRHGIIVPVNRAWEEFALANGGGLATAPATAPGTAPGIGADCLAACRQASSLQDESAVYAAAGIGAVLASELSFFTLEYPCHAPEQQLWFEMSVTPLRT